MAGSAQLDSTVLLDDLVGVVDGIRDDLHRSLGLRQWEVFSVVRTRSGRRHRDQRLKLIPQPLVLPFLAFESRLRPCGLDEAGFVRMEEISLSYTEAELTGGALAEGQQHYIQIEDAHGQGCTPFRFVLRGPPYPDRVETIGWIVQLEKAEISDEGDEPMPIILPGEALYHDLGSMRVLGTLGAPISFDYIVPAGKRAVIQQLNIVVRCGGDPTADGFGNLAGLANGCLVRFLETDLSVIMDPLDGGALKSNEDLALLGGPQTVLDSASDSVLAEWFLPTPVALAAAQRLRVQVRDDLTALQDFRISVRGYVENA